MKPIPIVLSMTVLVASLIATGAMAQPTRERAHFERWLAEAPGARAADSQANLAARQAEEQASKGGWRVFAGISGAHVNEIEGSGNNRVYERLQGDIGLKYPLLGSRRAQEESVARFERARLESQAQATVRRTQLGHQLADAYTDYWVNDRRHAVATRWHGHLREQLPELEQQVGKRLLASDISALRAALDGSRMDRDIAALERTAARERLGALLGRNVAAFTPVWPGDAPVCDRPGPLRQALNTTDPEVVAARASLALVIDQPAPGPAAVIQSGFLLQHSQVMEDLDDNGDETSAGLTAEMPLDLGNAASRYRHRRNAEMLAAQERLRAVRQTRLTAVTADLATLRQTTRQRAPAAQRLERARKDWQAARQRSRLATTNGLTALERGMAWYDAARLRLEREARWLKARARVESVSPASCRSGGADAPNNRLLTVPEGMRAQ